MARVFSTVLLSDAIRDLCKTLEISEVQAASEMVRSDTGRPISVSSLRRIRYTGIQPTMYPLMAILTWLDCYDVARFCIESTSVEVEPDGRITARRVSWPSYEDSRVIIGYWK